MFDPTPQGAVLADACKRDLYVFARVLSKPNVHRAAGGEKRHQPSDFLALNQTIELVNALSNSGDSRNKNPVATKAGRYGGSFTAKEIAIAYANWISASYQPNPRRPYPES
jgi:hypothetical protein